MGNQDVTEGWTEPEKQTLCQLPICSLPRCFKKDQSMDDISHFK